MKLEKYSSQNVKDAVSSRFNLDEGHVENLVADVYDMMVKNESLSVDIRDSIVRGHAVNIGKNPDKICDKFVEVLRGLGYDVSVVWGSVNDYQNVKSFRVRAI
ncbi:hypothetical protein 65p382 [Aeromonas phage 65]|uniref:Uncharacterized protein n=2 Tax=Ishigurovirus osborne TaxID=260149 RepID=A0A219YCM4_9CAUD|nr:hypothetical protein ST65p382 [Aeromonas phage 65]ADQ53389.1 hypothetical protein 65p382 [Aeromonas phage 65]APU01748.1 hypothetical protein [Aeromonas phage 65.2]